MTRAWLLLLVACKEPSNDDFPVQPGGPGGSGDRLDASTLDAFDPDAGMQINGRVCLVTDLRAPLACAATGAAGITVTLGTRTATTAADGSFKIAAPSGTGLVWRTSASDLVTMLTPFGVSTTIPSITLDAWSDILNSNGVMLVTGEGSIIARVVKGTTLQMGARAASTPAARFATLYDGPTALAWRDVSTGPAGTAWIPGAPVGANTLQITPAAGTGAMQSVPVEDQAITYVTVDLP
jgi:hypothetical protein